MGGHEELLAYLVRRLLENGANSSFVNRIADASLPLTQLLADPLEQAASLKIKRHPGIARPADLFGTERVNSEGLDMSDKTTLAALGDALARSAASDYEAVPLIDGHEMVARRRRVCAPADRRQVIGHVAEAAPEAAGVAMSRAAAAFTAWSAVDASERAAVLERAADVLQGRLPEFAALIVREGGRT